MVCAMGEERTMVLVAEVSGLVTEISQVIRSARVQHQEFLESFIFSAFWRFRLSARKCL